MTSTSSKGGGPPSSGHRQTFRIETWSKWDDEIDRAVRRFEGRFGIYPNLLLANPVTFNRIDLIANKEKVRGPEGEQPAAVQHTPLGEFRGSDYSLELCFDERLADAELALVYDTDPDGGGEPVLEDDVDLEADVKVA